jgi:hypothetical protein
MPTIANTPGTVEAAESDEALADFQFYAGKDKEVLRTRGIKFREVYALSFQIRIGGQTTIVKAERFKYGVGYYLIAPGRPPRIEDGVMSDGDLLGVAEKYFR